jgi:hypothetical protein
VTEEEPWPGAARFRVAAASGRATQTAAVPAATATASKVGAEGRPE